jgi:hypothetical protein
MTDEEVESALRYMPNADVGVCGGYNDVVGIDIDTLDPELQQVILDVLPEYAPRRIGNPNKAGLLLLRWMGKGDAPTRRYKDKQKKAIVEILGKGSQWVMPPSMWPGKGDVGPRPYEMDCGEVPNVEDLPGFDESHIEELERVLKPYLWERGDRKERNYPERTSSLREAERPKYEAYARAALRGEAKELAKVGENGRNNELFISVCRLGKYIHHGVLKEVEVWDALAEACSETGNRYIPDDGHPAFAATIKSGLETSEGDALPDLGNPSGRGGKEGKRPPKEEVCGFVVTGLDEVELEDIEWIWEGVLARGKLTLLAGPGG